MSSCPFETITPPNSIIFEKGKYLFATYRFLASYNQEFLIIFNKLGNVFPE